MTGVWIIFEGPDGAGKTSIAARATTLLSDPRSEHGGPTIAHHLTSESEFHEYLHPYDWTLDGGFNVVQDRCLLSDLVYAPVWIGKPSRLGEDMVRTALMRQVWDVLVIHVTADEQVLLERMRKRNDVRPDADPGEGQMHALLKGYARELYWWKEQGATIFEIDTSRGNFLTDLELQLMLSVGIEQLAIERS